MQNFKVYSLMPVKIFNLLKERVLKSQTIDYGLTMMEGRKQRAKKLHSNQIQCWERRSSSRISWNTWHYCIPASSLRAPYSVSCCTAMETIFLSLTISGSNSSSGAISGRELPVWALNHTTGSNKMREVTNDYLILVSSSRNVLTPLNWIVHSTCFFLPILDS